MKTRTKILVIGAGAAGLGAAVWLKHAGLDFMVVEGSSELPLNLHNGVHYLHSIPDLPFETNIKEITLTDGILDRGKIIHHTNLTYSLQYSEKVREIQHPSSIMDIGKRKTVFMPKSNSLNETLNDCYQYAGVENFNFGYWLESIDPINKVALFRKDEELHQIMYESMISAVPLDKFRKLIPNEVLNSMELNCAPVYVTNCKVEKIVPNWMINLYIPDLNISIYRASLLNGICSVESIKELTDEEMKDIPNLLTMFHFVDEEPQRFTWSTGKVISISKDDREKVLDELHKLSIYQLGRFGLWNRKLLVDSTINQAKEIVYYLFNKQYCLSEEKWNTLKKKLI